MKPNILFIMTDDQGAWAMRCAGNPDIITPNIDALARDGVRFTNFFCASPVCSPARASIVTGKIPSCHGILDWLRNGNVNTADYPGLAGRENYGKNPGDGGDAAIDYLAGHETYIELLNRHGYNCAHSGKWHLGDNVKTKPGFNKGYFTIGSGGCGYFSADVHEGADARIHDGYITDLITDKAIGYLNGMYEEDRPFYVSVHFTAPHSPWDPANHKPEHLKLYAGSDFPHTPRRPIHPWQIASAPLGDTDAKRRENLMGYYAAITAADENVGRIVADLKRAGKYDDTIIIFTSDNGMNLGQHGIWGKGNGTYPQNMYDSSVKVPFIVSCPALFGGGRVYDGLACQYDIFHTLLEFAGADRAPGAKQPGRSLVSAIKSPAQQDGGTVYIYDEYAQVRMIRTAGYKYVHRYMEGAPCEFFDLTIDPGEELNLFCNTNYTDIIAGLRAELFGFFDEYGGDYDGSAYYVNGGGQMDFPGREGAFPKAVRHYYPNKRK